VVAALKEAFTPYARNEGVLAPSSTGSSARRRDPLVDDDQPPSTISNPCVTLAPARLHMIEAEQYFSADSFTARST